jgi:hypothetical protein
MLTHPGSYNWGSKLAKHQGKMLVNEEMAKKEKYLLKEYKYSLSAYHVLSTVSRWVLNGQENQVPVQGGRQIQCKENTAVDIPK